MNGRREFNFAMPVCIHSSSGTDYLWANKAHSDGLEYYLHIDYFTKIEIVTCENCSMYFYSTYLSKYYQLTHLLVWQGKLL